MTIFDMYQKNNEDMILPIRHNLAYLYASLNISKQDKDIFNRINEQLRSAESLLRQLQTISTKRTAIQTIDCVKDVMVPGISCSKEHLTALSERLNAKIKNSTYNGALLDALYTYEIYKKLKTLLRNKWKYLQL